MSSSTRIPYLLALWLLAGTVVIMPNAQHQQILDPNLGMSITEEEMGKKNHTDCSVSVLLDPADTEVTLTVINRLIDTMKDTLTRMDIKGRLMFVYPSPYVAHNKLWLTYYIEKAKGGVVDQNTLIAATGEIDFDEHMNMPLLNMHRNLKSLGHH